MTEAHAIALLIVAAIAPLLVHRLAPGLHPAIVPRRRRH